MSLDFQRSYTKRELESFDRLHSAQKELEEVAREYCREYPDDAARRIVRLERENIDAVGFCVSDCLGDVESYNDIISAATEANVEIYRDLIEHCKLVRGSLCAALRGGGA